MIFFLLARDATALTERGMVKKLKSDEMGLAGCRRGKRKTLGHLAPEQTGEGV
jgi:hypothetical protein